jgi:hypothetical protein
MAQNIFMYVYIYVCVYVRVWLYDLLIGYQWDINRISMEH